jgi:hypothetical protein
MNIFFLHQAAASAAALHCDKHLVKMILESTQILYAVLSMLDIVLPDTDFDDIQVTPYKPTHKHHPSVLWVLGGHSHFAWLLELAQQLCTRYTSVYSNIHKCERHLSHIKNWVTEMDLPRNCSVDRWLQRLADMDIPQKCIDACSDKVATSSPPEGCGFGVVCAESKQDDVTSESLLCRADDKLDLVGSYRNYYAFKAKRMFVMKWDKTDTVPADLSPVMQSFLPGEQLMQPPPKRSRETKSVAPRKKPRKSCTFCGQDMSIPAEDIDWQALGFNSPCCSCCCGACGSRKLYQGQACC